MAAKSQSSRTWTNDDVLVMLTMLGKYSSLFARFVQNEKSITP